MKQQKTDLPIKDYITKQEFKIEIKKLEKQLGMRLTRTEKLLIAQMNLKFENMRDYFSTELKESNSRIITTVDPLLKELETRREDREIATAQMQRIEDDVDNIKQRVTQLEHS